MLKAKCACGAAYQVPDDKAGRTFKCRKCGGAVKVPAPSNEITNDDFLSALDGLEQSSQEEPAVRSMTREEMKSRAREPQAISMSVPRPAGTPRKESSRFLWNFFVHPAGICCLLASVLAWNVAGETYTGPVEVFGKVQRYGADTVVYYASWFGWGLLMIGALVVLSSLSQGGELHDTPANERWWSITTLVPHSIGILWLLFLVLGASPGSLATPVHFVFAIACGVMGIAFMLQVNEQADRMMALGCRLIPGFAFFVALTERGAFRHSTLGSFGMAAVVVGTVYSQVDHDGQAAALAAANAPPPVVQPVVPAGPPASAGALPSVCELLPTAALPAEDQQHTSLTSFVYEGVFQFRPPIDFGRHAQDELPDAARWEQSGVGPGENTLVFTFHQRLAGEDPNSAVWMDGDVLFIRAGSIDRQFKAADYELDQVSNNQMHFIRVRPTKPVQEGETLGYRVYVAFSHSHVGVIQASAPGGNADPMQALEHSALTLGHRQ